MKNNFFSHLETDPGPSHGLGMIEPKLCFSSSTAHPRQTFGAIPECFIFCDEKIGISTKSKYVYMFMVIYLSSNLPHFHREVWSFSIVNL